MFRLKIISCGDVVGDWPCPPDVECYGLVLAIDRACQWLRRFGAVVVSLDAPDGVTTVIGQWGKK